MSAASHRPFGPSPRLLATAMGTLVTCAGLQAAGIVDLTASPQTHPAVVLGLGAAAVVGALALAWRLDLPGLGARILGRARPPAEVVEELADLAGVARSNGLLPAATDERARSNGLFRSGLHLLVRDADERLIRSSLAAEMDRQNAATGVRCGLVVSVCRVLAAVLVVVAATAVVVMAASAGAPGTIGTRVGAGVLAAVLGCFTWLSLWRSIAGRAQLRAASEAFARLATMEAVTSIRLGEDRVDTAARLAGLMPAEPRQSDSARGAARRAA